MSLVPKTPVLTSKGRTNNVFTLKLVSSPMTGFDIEASTNLITWTNIGSAYTDTNGLLLFPDTNASVRARFYRSHWPSF